MKLFKWYIISSYSRLRIYGIISGDTRFSDGTSISTSFIEEISEDYENKRLIARTRSGSMYELSLPEINREYVSETTVCLQAFDIDLTSGRAQQILTAEPDFYKKAQEVLDRNELYICCIGTSVLTAYFRSGDEITELPADVYTGADAYTGTIVNTTRISDYVNGIDFRFYNRDQYIEPYSLGDKLEAVKIFNAGSTDLLVDLDAVFVCHAGEMLAISRKRYMDVSL